MLSFTFGCGVMIEREEDDSPRQGLGHRGCGALSSRAQSETTVRDARATVRKIPERTDAMVGTRAQKKRRLREGPAFVFRF